MATHKPYIFAYYCSGHGFGHATRVVALTHELLERSHRVHICTNAPEHVFQTVINAGASYRHAEIDAGIVQPKAYDVARRKTIEGLRRFLNQREDKLLEEVEWLKQIKADAVLVDAPFLPCAAAERAGISSVIISNFTFDSCYSYLSVSTNDDKAAASLSTAMQGANLNEATCTLHVPAGTGQTTEEEGEPPIPAEEIAPLVRQVIDDYSNASLLLRLPGCIPIPAFDTDVTMPAATWTDLSAHSFRENIMTLLARDPSTIPSCCEPDLRATLQRKRRRKVVDVPLIARPVAGDVYSKEKRKEILSNLGVPYEQHDPATTKILVVSFGGQSIPKPAASRAPTPQPSVPNGKAHRLQQAYQHQAERSPRSLSPAPQAEHMSRQSSSSSSQMSLRSASSVSKDTASRPLEAFSFTQSTSSVLPKPTIAAPSMQRLMTQDHIYLPGAPPALHRPGTLSGKRRHGRKISIEIPKDFRSDEGDPSSLEQEFSIPDLTTTTIGDATEDEQSAQAELLIPKGWIAIVCGISGKEAAEDLPDNFYAAPRDVYVPDLTAICDVLLGKLGYGTCSETVSTQTPFVYVPRPLFVEEFGLKRLMEERGTALPMSRADFEAGHWAKLIEEAYRRGRDARHRHLRTLTQTTSLDNSIGVHSASIIAAEIEAFLQG